MPRHTEIIEPDDPRNPRRSYESRSLDLGRFDPRRFGPVGLAVLVGGLLAVIGISFAVIAPLASGTPDAQALPATSLGASGSLPPAVLPSGAPSVGPSTVT